MHLSRRNVLRAAAGATALLAAPRGARAQTYPDRPIRLIVPFPPGGAFDTLGRPWADRIKPHLGTVVIENIGGGGASLGAAAAARSRPDGYTLLLGGTLPHVNEALLKSKPLYDPVKDLDPIMRIAVGYLAIAVHPSVPVNTLAELVAYIKANPGKVSYGHSGVGGTNHLIGELFKSVADIPDLRQIPYRGAGPAMTDLIAGQIPMGIVGVQAQSLGFHRSGALKILAFTSEKPLAAAPDIPTAVSAGFPDIANASSYGILAPAGTPKADDRQGRAGVARFAVDQGVSAADDRHGFRGNAGVGPGGFPPRARRRRRAVEPDRQIAGAETRLIKGRACARFSAACGPRPRRSQARAPSRRTRRSSPCGSARAPSRERAAAAPRGNRRRPQRTP
jgi:tripartite-type tricarboxylate transporter receptor subunit TctC